MADKKISALTGATTPLAGTEVLPIVQGGSTVKVSVANLTAGRETAASKFAAKIGTSGTYYRLYEIQATGGSAIGEISYNDTNDTMRIANLSNYVNTSITFYNNAADRMEILPNGNISALTGNLVIGTAGKGIDFSANTHAAGMTSELLNDYEEGTFTATLTASTTGPTTPVTATAYYTKIGRLVTCNILFSSVDTTGASGAILISGLPFTPALIRSVGACNMGGMGAIAAVSTVSSGNTTMEIWDATQVNNILIIPGAGKTVNTTISYLV